MTKFKKTLALFLAMSMLMSSTAFAAGDENTTAGEGTSIEETSGSQAGSDQGSDLVVCAKSEDCAAEPHVEGCPKYVAPSGNEDDQQTPAANDGASLTNEDAGLAPQADTLGIPAEGSEVTEPLVIDAGAESVTIKNVTFKNGVELTVNTTGKVILTGCIFEARSNKTRNARVLLNAGSAEITGNTFENDAYNVIEFSQKGNPLKDATISGNTFGTAGNNYISAYLFTEGAVVTVSGNTFANASNNDIVRISNYASTKNVTVNVSNNTLGSDVDAVVMFQNVVSATVASNDFTGVKLNVTNQDAPAGKLFYVWSGNAVATDNQPVVSADQNPLLGDKAAAQMNGMYYNSLQGAIDAAGSTSATVTLVNDITECVTINEGQDITLMLNGKTLNGKGNHTIQNKGKLNVGNPDGSSFGGIVSNEGDGNFGSLANYPGAVVSLNSGTFMDNTWYTIKNLGTMTINGAQVKRSEGDAGSSLIDNGWYGNKGNDLGLTGTTEATLTIENGSFEGGMNTVKNDDYGVLTIKYGTFSNTTGPAILNWNKATISGGAFVVNQTAGAVLSNGYLNDAADCGKLTITGGTFTAANGDSGVLLSTGLGSKTGGTLTITGGTFHGVFPESKTSMPYTITISDGTFFSSNNNVSTHCLEGFVWNESTHGIEPAQGSKAQIVGGKAYENLQTALNEVAEGQTVVLLTTVDGNFTISNKKNITLDGNGHTITGAADVDDHGLQIYCSQNVTLKDVTITGAGKSGLMINASSVTVEGPLNLTDNGTKDTENDTWKWGPVLNVGFGDGITGNLPTGLTFKAGATLTGVDTVYSDASDLANAKTNGSSITIGAVPGLFEVKGANCWTSDANAKAVAAAKIGDVYYATLQAAINAAGTSAATVTLVRDEITESVTIAKGQNITLNIPTGVTLKNSAAAQDYQKDSNYKHTITNNGTLTITGAGTVDNVSHGKAALYNKGTAYIQGCTFTRSAEKGTINEETGKRVNGGNSWYVVRNDGTMTISGGKIEANGKFSAMVSNNGPTMTITGGTLNSSNYTAIQNQPDCTLNISGGTITGGKDAHCLSLYGTTNISDNAVINGYIQAWTYDWYNSDGSLKAHLKTVVNISGGTINDTQLQCINGLTGYDPTNSIAKWGTDGACATVNITGGTLNLTGGVVTCKIKDATGALENVTNGDVCAIHVSGGTYSTDVSDYCVKGYLPFPNGSGKYVVEQLGATNAEAQIGTTYYKTLSEALAAATSGQTVTLLRAVTVDYSGSVNGAAILIPKGVSLDGNGKTIKAGTFTSNGHVVGINGSSGNTVLISNLTIVGTGATSTVGKHCLNIWGGANVRLVNVKLQDSRTAGMVINNSTVSAEILTTSGNGWGAVNVDKNSKFTVDTLSKIDEDSKVWSEDYDGSSNGSQVIVSDASVVTVYGIDGNKVHFTTKTAAEGNANVKARIGSVYYGSLQAAIAAATANQTVTLLNNVALSEKLTINKAITLDGNNKTITSTVADGQGTILVTASGAKIKNLTITANENAKPVTHGIQVNNAKNVTLTGLTIRNMGKDALLVNNGSTVTATDLTTSGNTWGAVNVDHGSAFSLSGTINIGEDSKVWSEDYGKENGSAVSVDGFVTVYGIDGNKVHFTTAEAAEANANVKAKIVNGNNTVYYTTLAGAVAAAQSGEAVFLVKDVTLNEKLIIDKAITLNGGTHTITSNVTDPQGTILVTAGGAGIYELTIAGDHSRETHGIQVWNATQGEVSLNYVTINNMGKDALLVNGGSTVTANNLTTSDNAWGAVNVDNRSSFTFVSGNLKETTKIWKDDTASTVRVPANWKSYTATNAEGKAQTFYTNDGELAISLDKAELSMTVGYTVSTPVKLDVSGVPEGATVVWSSSKENVATVDENGKVTAVAAGNATITATVGSMTANCTVTVTAIIPTVTLDQTSASVISGGSVTLTATVTPEGAAVAWSSSNEAVATVNNGVVTAVAAGTATITATVGNATSVKATATCTVTVNDPTVTLNRTSATVTRGNTVTLTATVTPADATVTWSSSNEAVATVNNGVVTAVAAGTATITATVDNVSATCEITVNNPAVNPDPGPIGPVGPVGPVNPPVNPNPPTDPDEGEEDLGDNDTPLVARPFTFVDVAQNHWFYNDVKTLFERGLINGMGVNAEGGEIFSPYTTSTRAMVATMLYRMAGSPSVEDLDITIVDVGPKVWYHDAAVWAYANGVFGGYKDGSFQGKEVITREQLAAVLHRYAASQGMDVSARVELDDFVDADQVSKWAREDMKWAVAVGLIGGRNGRQLAAKDSASRAELATLIVRFDSLLANAEEPENQPKG